MNIKTPTERWENGEEHHPQTKILFKFLADYDREVGGDCFCWQYGGDGDNGEELMYHLDAWFDTKDLEQLKAGNKEAGE